MSDAQSTGGVAGALGPLVTRIDHVGIAVRDLDAAIAFYARVFGLPMVHQETNADQGVREAMLGVGNAMIQLLAPLDETSTIAKFLERSGEGIQQLAFEVTDVVAAADRLRAQGVRVLYEHPRRGTSDSLVNFVHPKDCGGVLVELVQPASATTD